MKIDPLFGKLFLAYKPIIFVFLRLFFAAKHTLNECFIYHP